MKVDLTHIKVIHDLACTGSTGCREDLAQRLGISIRSLNDLIKYMRDDLDIPIRYHRVKQTYYCFEDGYLNFKFQRDTELVRRLIKLIESALILTVIDNAVCYSVFF